jgi:hypothetical protein
VEGIVQSCRDRFGPKRKDGARPLRGLARGFNERPAFQPAPTPDWNREFIAAGKSGVDRNWESPPSYF